jgi:hypothetical protein
MFPPQQNTSLDIAALSGICGSISIACWVVVFSPQILENFRRASADGLSVVFIVVWLAGDVFVSRHLLVMFFFLIHANEGP